MLKIQSTLARLNSIRKWRYCLGNWKTVACGLVLITVLSAQETTRVGEIEKERTQKAANLQPDEVSTWERRLRDFKDKDYLGRFGSGFHGFRAKIGNMVTGGGFAIG